MPLTIDDTYSTERLKLVLDSTRLGMWDWNPQTNEVLFDENWAAMLGLSISDLSMTLDDWASRVHPDDMEKCFDDIQAHLNGKTDYYENLHRMKHADGHWLYILDRGRIVEYDEAGNAIRFTGTHADVTPLKVAEFEASLALKSRDRFFSAMSHELRAPIHAMLGLIEHVKEQLPQEYLVHILNIAQDSGQHLLFLIKDILDAAKIRGAQIQLQQSVFSLNQLIKKAVDLFFYRASEKRITLDYKSEYEKDVFIYSDQGRVYQILINILSNAIKYTEKGAIIVELKRSEDAILLSVSDTGIGIEDINSIFRPFFSMENQTNVDNVHSTGLGLSITKENIERLGFWLKVESIVGRGSRFTIGIPEKNMANMPISDVLTTQEADRIEPQHWPSANILVVDDAPINITLLEMMLEDTPLKVFTAENAKDAMDILACHSVDIVLSDLHMPHTGGLKLCNQVKEQLQNNPPKFIIASADARNDVWSTCLENRVDDYLEKPFNEEQLIRLLDKYLTLD